MRFRNVVLYWMVLLASAYTLQAQTRVSQEGSLRSFVQSFYDWYVPVALKDNPVPASDLALQQKGSAFEPRLARDLKEDLVAQAEARGVIVGLDFDPFLNSQDPGDRYEAGKISQKGESYFVEIYSVSSGKKREKPDVIAELSKTRGQWIFVNFHYPPDRDLVSLLKRLRDSRANPAVQHASQ